MRHAFLVLAFGVTALASRNAAAQPCASCIPLDHPSGGTYQGQLLGLYPGGANEPPPAHLGLALAARDAVIPRDDQGVPDPDGWQGFLAIGMSNTNQEFAVFERDSEFLYQRNPRLLRVDGAVGGWSANLIVDRNASYWTLVDQRLAAAGLDPDQVQVVWLKEAENMITNPSFPAHAETLTTHLRGIVRHLKYRFPQLQLCYLSSRIYGGYGGGEPIAYDSGYAVRWLIEAQMNGDPALNPDPAAGPVEAPVLLWGPYLWANGTTPRASDGLVWLSSDLESDHTHPSPAGEAKVAGLLRDFFGYDRTATDWFLAPGGTRFCYALTLTATADATVDDAQPAQNFGGATALSWSYPGVRSYVRFRLDVERPTKTTALHAKLSLKCPPDLQIGGVDVLVVSDSTWNEATITAANAPSLGSLVGTIPPASRGTALSLDVTSAVAAALAAGSSSLDLALRARLNSTPLQQVGSRESLDPPRLVLAADGLCLFTGVGGDTIFSASELHIALGSNPFAAGGTVLLHSRRALEHAVVDIFDVRGARVRRLFQGTLPAGQRRHAWDARNDAGAAVPNGVYWIRALAQNARAARRGVLVK
jgi:hypothetical protein